MNKLILFVFLVLVMPSPLYPAEGRTEAREKITKEMFEMKEGRFTPEAERKAEEYRIEQEKRLEKEDADRRKALEEGKITQTESDALAQKIAEARTEVQDKLAQLTTLREQYLDPEANRKRIEDQIRSIGDSLKVTQFVLEASIQMAAEGVGIPDESTIKDITDPGYKSKFDIVLTPTAFDDFKDERSKTVKSLRDLQNKLDKADPNYQKNFDRVEQSIKLINDSLLRLENARKKYLDTQSKYQTTKEQEPSPLQERLLKDYENLMNIHKARAEGANKEIDRITLNARSLAEEISTEPKEPNVIPSIYYDIDFSRDMFKNTPEAAADFQEYLDERKEFIEDLKKAQQELRANGGLEEGSLEDDYISFTIDQTSKTLQELTAKREQYINNPDASILRDVREIDNTLNTGTDLAQDIIEEAEERALEEPARLYETRFNPNTMFKDTPNARVLLDKYIGEHEARINTWEEALRKLSDEGKLMPQDEDYRYISDAKDVMERQLKDLEFLRKDYLEKPDEETLNKAREINDLIDTATYLVQGILESAQAKIPEVVFVDPAFKKLDTTVLKRVEKATDNLGDVLESTVISLIDEAAQEQGVPRSQADVSAISASDVIEKFDEKKQEYRAQAEELEKALLSIPDPLAKQVVQDVADELKEQSTLAGLAANPTESPEKIAKDLLNLPPTPFTPDVKYESALQSDLAHQTKNPVTALREELVNPASPLKVLDLDPTTDLTPGSASREYTENEIKTKINRASMFNRAIKFIRGFFETTPKAELKTAADTLESRNKPVKDAINQIADPATGAIKEAEFKKEQQSLNKAAATVATNQDTQGKTVAGNTRPATNFIVNTFVSIKDFIKRFVG